MRLRRRLMAASSMDVALLAPFFLALFSLFLLLTLIFERSSFPFDFMMTVVDVVVVLVVASPVSRLLFWTRILFFGLYG